MDLLQNNIISKHKDYFERFELNKEFADLYRPIKNRMVQEIFESAHHELNGLFRKMNTRLPTRSGTAHYWADESRDLIFIIEILLELYHNLKGSKFEVKIDEYYETLFYECREFLSSTGGSEIPENHEKITLYYNEPLFSIIDSVSVTTPDKEINAELELIGEGSYAKVFKYRDAFYRKNFVLKRAIGSLNDKEIVRFKKEFEIMKNLSSPYIVEVYCYRDEKKEYIMEYMDYTLKDYIEKRNNVLTWGQRKGIVLQILKGFIYTQKKGILHRDISPNNVLIKQYDDGTNVVKISDFGLVKTLDSSLTSYDSDIKGVFNDPKLRIEGFRNYDVFHESYALTLMIYYVMTGKTNFSRIKDYSLRSFVEKGTNPIKEERYSSALDVLTAFNNIIEK